MREEFARRLKFAFDDASNAEIARRLKTTDSTVKYYTDGARLPVFEMLVQIGRVTGCNLHWLLTGNGPKRAEKEVAMFSDDEEKKIKILASKAGRSFESQVKVLTVAAIEFKKAVD